LHWREVQSFARSTYDPSSFGLPQMAIFTIDRQGFHLIPDSVPSFERPPPQ
jgi:hypothetical protein